MCGAAIGFKVLAYSIISSCGTGQQEGRVDKAPSSQSVYVPLTYDTLLSYSPRNVFLML